MSSTVVNSFMPIGVVRSRSQRLRFSTRAGQSYDCGVVSPRLTCTRGASCPESAGRSIAGFVACFFPTVFGVALRVAMRAFLSYLASVSLYIVYSLTP